MAKSILWRSETRKFEFIRTQDHKLSISISGIEEAEPSMSVTLTVEDLRGIVDIIDDHRRDIEWDLDHLPKQEVTDV